jgi:hypothetical protein
VDARERLDCDGFLQKDAALSGDAVQRLRRIADAVPSDSWERRADGTPISVRNLHLVSPGLLEVLADAGVLRLAATLLEAEPWPVSAALFDKVPGANWTVPGHQDLMVPLAKRSDLPRYTQWVEREGVVYARPPEDLLNELIAIRVQLDDCAPGDGSLDVVPGSHTRILRAADAMDIERSRFVPCFGQSGSVLVMRPLLVHRSSPLSGSLRRRVIHAVFSPRSPGPGVNWTWGL